jgi:hypothetical protein
MFGWVGTGMMLTCMRMIYYVDVIAVSQTKPQEGYQAVDRPGSEGEVLLGGVGW